MAVEDETGKPDVPGEARRPSAQRRLAPVVAKLADAEARLLRLEEERQADADMIGRLLGEVGERKTQLDAAVARAERAERSITDTEHRIAELHRELEKMDATYAEAVVAIEAANERASNAEKSLSRVREESARELEGANDRVQIAVDEIARLRAEIETERAARKEESRAVEDARVKMEALRDTAAFASGPTISESLRRSSGGSIDVTEVVAAGSFASSREIDPDGDAAWMLEALGGALDDTCAAMRTVAHRVVATRTIFDLVRISGKNDPGGEDVLVALRETLHDVTHAEERVGKATAAIARASSILAGPPPRRGAQLALRRVIATVRAAREALEPLVPADREDREPK